MSVYGSDTRATDVEYICWEMEYRQIFNISRRSEGDEIGNHTHGRSSLTIACQRCTNYIFILHLTPGLNELHKGNCKTGWESLKVGELVRRI